MSGYLRSAGLSAMTIGLASARSFSDRTFAGRWSAWLLATILIAFAAAAASWVFAIRARRRPEREPPVARSARVSFDLAVLLWGAAYLLSAWLEPDRAARILELAPFGAEPAVPSVIEWMALVLATVSTGLMLALYGKGRWEGALIVVAAAVAALLALEGVVRVKTAVAPAVMGFPTSSTRAWLRRFVSLNAEGFRDGAHAIDAGDGVQRLLIVGDSVAFGWGIVRLEDRFGEQLATRLKGATGVEWEAINASRPDSATPEHLLFLDAMSRYHPDVVVLLYVFNDIDYLSRVTPREQWGRFTPVAVLFRNSYLFQEAYVRVRRWTGAAETATSPYLDEQLLARHIKDVSRFVANGRALGATVKVVPIAPAIVVEPSVRQIHETFLSRATAAGIPLCSVAQAFGSESFDALTVNALDRHPSERAHRLAAEATAPCLSESLARWRSRDHHRTFGLDVRQSPPAAAQTWTYPPLMRNEVAVNYRKPICGTG